MKPTPALRSLLPPLSPSTVIMSAALSPRHGREPPRPSARSVEGPESPPGSPPEDLMLFWLGDPCLLSKCWAIGLLCDDCDYDYSSYYHKYYYEYHYTIPTPWALRKKENTIGIPIRAHYYEHLLWLWVALFQLNLGSVQLGQGCPVWRTGGSAASRNGGVPGTAQGNIIDKLS